MEDESYTLSYIIPWRRATVWISSILVVLSIRHYFALLGISFSDSMANAVEFIIVARQLMSFERQTKRKFGGVVITPGLRIIGIVIRRDEALRIAID